MPRKSTRRPSRLWKATMIPRKSGFVSICGVPSPVDMRPIPICSAPGWNRPTFCRGTGKRFGYSKQHLTASDLILVRHTIRGTDLLTLGENPLLDTPHFSNLPANFLQLLHPGPERAPVCGALGIHGNRLLGVKNLEHLADASYVLEGPLRECDLQFLVFRTKPMASEMADSIQSARRTHRIGKARALACSAWAFSRRNARAQAGRQGPLLR
jgi:hypothetical protein